MSYPTYLIHFNKNHSKANGQFVSGDGDGDGIANDHAHQRKKDTASRYAEAKARGGKKMGIGKGLVWGSVGGALATSLLSAAGESFDNDVLRGASYISGLSTVALTSIGSGMYASGKKAIREAANDAFMDSISGNEEARRYMREKDKYSYDD